MKTMKTVSTKREKEMACFASFYKDENKITLNSVNTRISRQFFRQFI